MSVVIRGMKFPKGCDGCEIVQDYDEDSTCCPFLRSESWYGAAPDYRLEECPLTRIQTPYGRLIDDYKLLRALIKAFPNQSMNFYDTLERVIDEAPTIIEAEV